MYEICLFIIYLFISDIWVEIHLVATVTCAGYQTICIKIQ